MKNNININENKEMKWLKISALFAIFLLFYSCNDLIVADISEEKVTICSPANDVAVVNSTVTFWWENLEDATSYNIQVVSPSFDAAQQLWYDSIVVDNKVTFSLNPGKFQWRVKAINDISETKYAVASFRIDSTMDLSNQIILLYSPKNGTVFNTESIDFQWNQLYNATDYKIRIIDAFNETVTDKVLQENKCNVQILKDGTYSWSVRGQNETSNTSYSSGSFMIDKVQPDNSILLSPTNNEVIMTDSVAFLWNTKQDSGSEIFDSLFVYSDAELKDVVLSARSVSNSYKDTLSTGTYYWNVRSTDKAGNKSESNETYKFIKQ